jgi:hypothetical protein
MWQPWGGKQPKAPDFIKEEDVADQVTSATGSSRRGQTHAQDTLDYTETQLRAMRPCSLCKGRRKGLSHCIRSGHVPGSVSSRLTAVGGGVGKPSEVRGGKQGGGRALLLIWRSKDAEVGCGVLEGPSRLMRADFALFNGIFQFDPSCLSRDKKTPGQVREVLCCNCAWVAVRLGSVYYVYV